MSECPYCLDEVEGGSEAVECRACGTAYHKDCWDENGGCCVKTCDQAVRHIDVDMEDEVPEHLILSREAVERAAPHGPRRPNPCIKCGREVPEGELHCRACTPEPPENQDAKNAGPLLMMIGVIAALLAWLIIASLTPNSVTSP